jgi:regulator of protease activity HflC (stomatin/prohibitin superfamily)
MRKSNFAVPVVFGGLAMGSLVFASLLWRPFDRPEYVEIDTSESAFLIPLEGDTMNQSAFQSVHFLDQRKVAAKRIQITHRWNQTGRLPAQGEWIPSVRLIKVDRRPVTREWTSSSKTGTSARNEAIAVETRDSVNFSMGVSCTARIPEDLAAVYLYSYPSKSLAEMMDSEIRARIQEAVSTESAKYDFDILRSKKNEIMAAVRLDLVPFFKSKGIEISTVAILGGLTYDNPELQRAIDETAKSSQLKVAAEARREAQEVENKTMRLAAEGRAQAAKLEAQGKADAELARAEAEAKIKRLSAEAEAESLRKIAAARVQEAQEAMEAGDLYVKIKSLEMETQRWKQWDGRYPSYVIQPGIGLDGRSWFGTPTLPGETPRKTALAETPGK